MAEPDEFEGLPTGLIEEPPIDEPSLLPAGLIEEPPGSEIPQAGVPFYPGEGSNPVDPYAAWNTAATSNPQLQTQAETGANLIKAAYAAGGMPAVWKVLADNGATPQQIQQMQTAFNSGGPAAGLATLAGFGLLGAGIAQNLLGQTPRTTTSTGTQTTTGTQQQAQQQQQQTAFNQQQQQNSNVETNQNTTQNLAQNTGQTYTQQTGQQQQQQTSQNFNQAGSQTANQNFSQQALQTLINSLTNQQQQQQQGTTTPTYAAPMVANYQASQASLQPGAQALFGQGAGMMQGLLQGQIPAGLQTLASAIADPVYADAVRQATEQARLHGFHDAPLSSPVGGAVLSPLLNNAAAQEAQLTATMIQNLIPQFINPGLQAGQLALGGLGAVPGLGGAYAQTGTATGQQAGSQQGTTSQTGSQSGGQTSTLGGSQTGSLTGSQTGTNMGSQTGFNTVQQTGQQTGTQTGQQTGTASGTGSQQGSQNTTGQTMGNLSQTGSVTQPQPSIIQTATSAAPLLTGAGAALTNPATQQSLQALWNLVSGQGQGNPGSPAVPTPPAMPPVASTPPIDGGAAAPPIDYGQAA